VSVTIAASLVKQLRDETGAGMMDCKRALEETGGDIEAARRLLRERGMAAAAKRAGRGTTEGLVGYRILETHGAMVAVGCETEPVSKSEEFQTFAKRVLDAVDANGAGALDDLEQDRQDLIARLGENIVIVGTPARFEKVDGGIVDGYVHPPANKLGVLVQIRGGTTELAQHVAQQIAALAPQWITREDVPADIVATEREIFFNSDVVQSKPEQAREKIVEGMLNKRFFAERVLVDQPWIRDDSKTIGQLLQGAGAEVLEFERFSVAG
jgi:elongation factor Ts